MRALGIAITICLMTAGFTHAERWSDDHKINQAIESVTPPATLCGGALALTSLVLVVRADIQGRMDKTAHAKRSRRHALNLAWASAGALTFGWIEAHYIQRRFGIRVKVEF